MSKPKPAIGRSELAPAASVAEGPHVVADPKGRHQPEVMVGEVRSKTTRLKPPAPLGHTAFGVTALATVAVLTALTTVTSAGTTHHAHRHRARMSSSSDGGFLITTTNRIRIDASGEVVSKLVPIIEKERKFNDRALKELMKNP